MQESWNNWPRTCRDQRSDGTSSMTKSGLKWVFQYIHVYPHFISVYGSSKRGHCDILWSTCPSLQIFHGFPLFFQHVQTQMTNEGLPSRENGRNSLKFAGPRPVWNSNLFGGPDTAQYAVSDVRSMIKCWLPFIGTIGGWSYHTSSKRELFCPSWILIYSSRELYSANIKIPNISFAWRRRCASWIQNSVDDVGQAQSNLYTKNVAGRTLLGVITDASSCYVDEELVLDIDDIACHTWSVKSKMYMHLMSTVSCSSNYAI